jgi:hypothetical protein
MNGGGKDKINSPKHLERLRGLRIYIFRVHTSEIQYYPNQHFVY